MEKKEFIKLVKESNGDMVGVMRANSITLDTIIKWLSDSKFIEELITIQGSLRYIMLSVIAKKAIMYSDLKAIELYFKLTNITTKEDTKESGLIVQVLNKELKSLNEDKTLNG